MKRFISLMLALLMLLLSVNAVVFANAVTEKTYSAKDDIYNTVEGEGFHHNSSAAGRTGLETDGNNVVLRQKEWICYDISDFESGVYNVSILRSSTSAVTISVLVDDVTALSDISVTSSGGYANQSEFVLGEIELSGNQQKLKLLNTTTNRALFIESITLKKLDPLKFLSYDANVAVNEGVVARGADTFTLNMSAELDSGTVSNETVMIKDSGGTALSADVSADGNLITVKLRESLDYSSAYTIYIDGVKAANGQGLETAVSESFETSDSSDVRGTASIEVTSFEAKDGVITATGTVKSSAGLNISGRNVTLSIKAEGDADEEAVANAESGENGEFTVSYEMPESSEAGNYEVKITSDYVTEGYTDSFLYFSEALGSELTEAFSGLSKVEDVKNAVEAYEEYLGIDMAWAESVVSDFDKAYEKMLNKTFEDAESVINALKQAVYFEAVMQTEEANDIVEILDDELKAVQLTGFNESLWDALESAGKTKVAKEALSFTSVDLSELAESLNESVKAQLISELNLSSSKISFTSDEILTGETAEITASVDAAVNDVSGMHFEFTYDDESAALFETDGIIVEAPSGMEYETSASDNVLSIDVKAEGTVSLSGDIMTVKIPASGRAGGEHFAAVSGCILYHPQVITDENENLSIPFTVSQNPVITVNVIKSMEISAPDVINRIEGEGFHDEPSLGGSAGLDVSGNTVIYRNGEWGAYDISALAEGKYQFSVNFASNAGTTFGLEAEGNIISQTMESSGGYGSYVTKPIGIIKLDGLQKTFKFLNNGPGSAYVKTIYIERVEALAIADVSTNAGISDNVIPRGTDRITITYNNILAADGIKDNSVAVKDKNGNEIPCSAAVSDKNVIVDLKEALDYNKEYTVFLKDVKDRFAQTLSSSVNLTTDDESNTSGTSSIDIDTWKVSGKEFTAEGKILSSGGVGIKGRTISLSAKAPGGTEYEEWASGMSGEDGVFSLSYTFDDDADSGKYLLELAYEYAKSSYKANAYYFDDALSTSLAEEFSNLPDGAAVKEKLNEHADELGIDMDSIQMDVDISFIADKMARKEYATVAEVIDDVNKRHALEKVNQALSAQEIRDIIDSEDALKEIGEIQRDKWNELSDEEQQQIATDIKNGGRIENPDELIEKIDELINKVLEERYELSAAVVSVNSSEVNVGQSASLTFTASQKQENVVGICIEIDYDASEALLFENTFSYTLSKDLKNLSVKKTVSDGKIRLDITVIQVTSGIVDKVSFRNDIITLAFKADSAAVGSYNPKVSGYITYHTDTDKAHQSEAYFVDVPFELDENPTVKVNAVKDSGGNDYRGGGGASGGDSYGTTGSSGSAPSIPSITDEGLTTEAVFSDLDSVPWAKDSIEALALKGVVNGRGDGTFAPNDSVTRAEFCKMITVAFGAVKSDAECEFSDVSKDAWYYTYVASAKSAGFVTGRTEDEFAPFDTITREEMAAIALRALGIEGNNSSDKFKDDDDISAYAKAAVYTLKDLGILDGVGDNMFAPKAVVTRAMAAKVIYALMIV